MKNIIKLISIITLLAGITLAGTKEDYDAAKAIWATNKTTETITAYDNAWYAHAKFVAPKVGNSNLTTTYRDYCFRFTKKFIDTSEQSDNIIAEVDAILYPACVALLNDPAISFINTSKTKRQSQWAQIYNYVMNGQAKHPADAAVFQANQKRRARTSRDTEEVLYVSSIPTIIFMNQGVISAINSMKVSLANGSTNDAVELYASFRTNFPTEYKKIIKQYRILKRNERLEQ